jgi:hypothetical protein
MVIVNKIHIPLCYLLLFFMACGTLLAQLKPLPISISVRKSLWGKSYVLQVANASTSELTIVLLAKEKSALFDISAGKTKDIGWAQGFSFDANNHFAITAAGYDTVKQTMPREELSPWKLTFTDDRGLALSLSKNFLQAELSKNLGLPIKQKVSNIFEISLNDPPVLNFKEGSNRVFADASLQAYAFSGKLKFPLFAKFSFVPSYSPSTRQLLASEIQVDEIDVKLLPAEWTDVTKQIFNNMISTVISRVVLYRLDQKEQKYAKLIRLRDVRIKDGRLEVLIL